MLSLQGSRAIVKYPLVMTDFLEQALKELGSNVKISLVEIKEESNGESEPTDQPFK